LTLLPRVQDKSLSSPPAPEDSGAGFDDFVRREKTQGLIRAARRQAGLGQMNMRKRLLVFGPARAGPPQLGDNASLHRPVINRREQRQGAQLVVEGKARGAGNNPTFQN
jgi:hypothetical protein